jgi:hypothetical protein
VNKKIRTRYIFLLAFFFAAGIFTYKKLSFRHEKKVVIQKLEEYRKAHAIYPGTLDELDEDFGKNFYYSPDRSRQSFILSYDSGIMGANTNRYDSQTKEWTQKFNY